MNVEGELVLRMGWDGHRVTEAHVASSRPFATGRMLEGMTPAEAGAVVPQLFGICRRAQSAASFHALAAAGAPVQPTALPADVALETIQEYFWRLLIDWPQTMGRAIDTASVAQARRAIESQPAEPLARGRRRATLRAATAALLEIAERSVYGMPAAAWLALDDETDLSDWTNRGATVPAQLLGLLLATMRDLGRSGVALMPPPGRESLLRAVVPAMVRDARFARAPTWDGEPVETGALARMRSKPLIAALLARDGNSIATRMTARLVELATLLLSLDAQPTADVSSADECIRIADGEGLGAVQTARGLLLHRVHVARGRIAHYQIVAPTEWNFHPQGPLVRGLSGVAADDRSTLARLARLAVQALDPCVAFRIEVGHA